MANGNNYLLGKSIDKESFEIFFSKYWERLYCYCFKITQNRELSQNIVQNIFIDLWEKRKKTNIADMERYLFRAAKFQIFNHYRDKKRNHEILQDKFEENIPEIPDSPYHELLEILDKLLDKLPEKRGIIFRMNKLQKMSVDEIASSLNISSQTVKNQVTIALKQIKSEAYQLNSRSNILY